MAKKILYISFNNPQISLGVYRKEKEFCDAMQTACKNNGIIFQGIDIFTADPLTLTKVKQHDSYNLKNVATAACQGFSAIPFFCSLFRIRPVFKEAYRQIKLFKPDAILWRYNVTYVPGIFNPKKIYPDVKFISEHQTKEIEELRMTLPGYMLSPIIKRNAQRVFQNIDAVIGVTSEIRDYELEIMGRDLPALVLTNSIDVERYPLREHNKYKYDVLRMLFVGSHTAGWHGLDRLLAGMATYRGDPLLELHIAGNVSSTTRKLIRLLNVSEQVFNHGYQSGKDLDLLYDNADIAIGTLAIHRKNLKSGSTLKVREYMARGIPFIISYRDEDLSEGLPFFLKLPANDDPVDINKIVGFTQSVYTKYDEGLSPTMRAYAQKHMDYTVKIDKLLKFIQSQLSQQH